MSRPLSAPAAPTPDLMTVYCSGLEFMDQRVLGVYNLACLAGFGLEVTDLRFRV